MTHSRSGLARALALFAGLGCLLPAGAEAADIIVRRDAGLTAPERADVRADAGVTFSRMLPVRDAELVTVPAGDQAQALAALNADPDVQYAEPVVRFTAAAASDDPEWGRLWAFENTGQPIQGRPGLEEADIDVPEAWAVSRGANQTVAVIDTGIDLEHRDLAERIAPGGRSFVSGVSSPDDDDPYGHGTNVAGVIAAEADNGLGVAGVAPDARLLPLKALKSDGSGDSRSIGEAVAYAGQLGIRVLNLSLGGPNDSQFMRDAMAAYPGTLYIVPAGNGDDYYSDPDEIPLGDDNDGPVSESSGPQYPCNFPLPNLICVGATDNNDSVTSWSNFGAVSVDLFAPGQSIYTTLLNGGYGYRSGTSLSAPMVAGEAALLLAAHPKLTAASLRQLLLTTVDSIRSAAGLSVTGGRANAANAVTVPVADADDDGVLDNLDNCSTVANGVQTDADADALGDACDPTPRGPDVDGDGKAALDDSCPEVPGDLPDGCPSPPPIAEATPQTPQVPAPAPTPTPQAAARIVSLDFKVTPKTCPKSNSKCAKTAKVTVKVSRQAKVAVKVEKRVKQKGRWVWKRVSSKSLTANGRGKSLTVRGRSGRSPSRYRVTAAIAGAAKAVSFRV